MAHDIDRHDVSDLRFETFPSGVSRFVSASFDSLDSALDATRDLESRGYGRERINVVMATDVREHHVDTHPRYEELEENAVVVDEVALEQHRKTAEGAGTGGVIGGALGAAGAAVAAVGTTLVIPPLGIAIAGPVAAMLAGLGAGAAAGGLVGALVGGGMTEYRARQFQKMVKEGRVIVGAIAHTEPERTNIAEILRDHGGEEIPDATE
jgi:hypothetical protein